MILIFILRSHTAGLFSKVSLCIIHFVGIPFRQVPPPSRFCPFLGGTGQGPFPLWGFFHFRIPWTLPSLSSYQLNSPPPCLLPLIILQMASCKGVLCLPIYSIFSTMTAPSSATQFSEGAKKSYKENIVTPWENEALK